MSRDNQHLLCSLPNSSLKTPAALVVMCSYTPKTQEFDKAIAFYISKNVNNGEFWVKFDVICCLMTWLLQYCDFVNDVRFVWHINDFIMIISTVNVFY